MAHHINKSENLRYQNISTYHATKLAKSGNYSLDLFEGLMERNNNLSHTKSQNTNLWLSEQNVTEIYMKAIMHWHNTVLRFVTSSPLSNSHLICYSTMYLLLFENCECSNVTVTVSKSSLCWYSFKNASLNNRFCIKVCRRHTLRYHLRATENAMLYVAFFLVNICHF
jgi:hypothetical protein